MRFIVSIIMFVTAVCAISYYQIVDYVALTNIRKTFKVRRISLGNYKDDLERVHVTSSNSDIQK